GLLAGTPRFIAFAQEATPIAGTASQPGVALARVRKLPSAALNEAIYPEVMRRFLPVTAAIPGFLGYLFAFHATDPTASISVTFLRDDAAADAAEAAAKQFVSQLDPRFVVETPVSVRRRVRIYETTTKPVTELPPFPHGCAITMRNRVTAPGVDVDQLVATASTGLLPLLRAMPGFVLYCWIQTA